MRKSNMARLHIFPDEEVGHTDQLTNDINQNLFKVPKEILDNITSQIPQVKPVPKRLTEYSEAEKEKFPKLFEPSKDFVRK